MCLPPAEWCTRGKACRVRATSILFTIVTIAAPLLLVLSPGCTKPERAVIEYRADERVFALSVGFSRTRFGGVPANALVDQHFGNPDRRAAEEQFASFLDAHALHPAYYIRYVLSLSGADRFEESQSSAPPLPRLSLRGFNVVLERFHREAAIHTLWLQFEGQYEEEIRRWQRIVPPLIEEVSRTLGVRGSRPLVFIPDPLGLPGSYGMAIDGIGYVVVSTGHPDELLKKTLAHEYLHTVVTPVLEENEELVQEAGKAVWCVLTSKATEPLSADEMELIWATLVGETFVRVLSLHLDGLSAEEKDIELAKLECEGYFAAEEVDDLMNSAGIKGHTVRQVIPEFLESVRDARVQLGWHMDTPELQSGPSPRPKD